MVCEAVKKLALILCLALAACGPYVPPDEVCVRSHTVTDIVPVPMTTIGPNNTVTITYMYLPQDDEVCDEYRKLSDEEKQQLIKEHQK